MEIEYLKSKENPAVKYAKALHKTSFSEEENVFILEGVRIIEEAVKAGLQIKTSFFTEEFYGKNADKEYFKKLVEKSEKKYFVNDNILKNLSRVETNPGILVLINKKLITDNPDKISGNIIVYFDNIKDPGNIGTILRTSLAFGIKDIIFSQKTVSAYNDKLIRSSAGAIFKTNLYHVNSVGASGRSPLLELKNKGYKIYSTSSYAKTSVVDFDFKSPCVLIFGEEAGGVSGEIKNISDEILKLSLKEGVESLNVSVSAAIFMYEIARKNGLLTETS